MIDDVNPSRAADSDREHWGRHLAGSGSGVVHLDTNRYVLAGVDRLAKICQVSLPMLDVTQPAPLSAPATSQHVVSLAGLLTLLPSVVSIVDARVAAGSTALTSTGLPAASGAFTT